MRSFPRAARRRLAVATATLALTMGALSVPHAVADDDLEHEQKSVQGEIDHADHELDESSSELRTATLALRRAQKQLATAQGELRAAQVRLTAARLRDHQMQLRLDTAVQRLAEARAELERGRAAMTDQRDAVVDTVTSFYQEGDPELLAFASLLDSDTPSDLTRRMEARKVIVGRETRTYDDLHAAEVLLRVNEREVEAARDAVSSQRKAAAVRLTETERLRDRAVEAAEKVRTMVSRRAEAQSQASRAKQHDLRVLAQLKKREDWIRRQIMAEARKSTGTGFKGRSGAFLDKPVDGPVTSPFGWRIHPIFGYRGLHDGTDFGVSCGEALRASAPGRVINRYYDEVYGNRLYLSVGRINGKSIVVVYNHMSGYRVAKGAWVNRGETVGYVGDTGWSTGCHLHFTVLVNGRAVDPMRWL